MNASVLQSLQRALALVLFGVPALGSIPAVARQAVDIVGSWEIARDQMPGRCRLMLNHVRSDKGDYFVGVPVTCRRMMPILGKVGRWNLTDDTHLALTDPGGTAVLALVADGNTFKARGDDGDTYRMVAVPKTGRSVTEPEPSGNFAVDQLGAPPPVIQLGAPPPVIQLGAPKSDDVPTRVTEAVAPRRTRGLTERPIDLAGRYAILRDKTHDTGCMLTLDDKTRVKGGDRAALAPACRDQGIVVFDPSAWQIIDGRLVLTAKAGHTTHLDKQTDGTWLKDPGEGKSLSLKKL